MCYMAMNNKMQHVFTFGGVFFMYVITVDPIVDLTGSGHESI